MFKNLPTGTKLFALCAAFILAIAATTYQLVAEKRLAVDFARKELLGSGYLRAVRDVYSAIMIDPSRSNDSAVADRLVAALAAQAKVGGLPGMAESADALVEVLRRDGSSRGGRDVGGLMPETLDKARSLATRIADDSNLSLDPDLDTYYLQTIIATSLPILLARLGELQSLVGSQAAAADPSDARGVRMLVLDGLLRSTAARVNVDLAAAYRGNHDGRLKPTVGGAFDAMTSNLTSYLGRLSPGTPRREGAAPGAAAGDVVYAALVGSAIDAWNAAQSELDRLLHQRIDGLNAGLASSLALVGLLTGLSVLLAFLTHRHIARPLARLEAVARAVRETRNYDLRMDHGGDDEIGRLSTAFNDMMSELSHARRREMSDHAELARAARLSTAGAMSASIAHEIRQPLAAIVNNANAGIRWLASPVPDVPEAQASLKRIVDDGRRAGEVIGSVRAMVKTGDHASDKLDVNNLIREVLSLSHNELHSRRISVRAELHPGLPLVSGDRVQLQQVFMNLILNAAEAMSSVEDRARRLLVKSERHGLAAVLIEVEDSGTGIDANDVSRIFDPFFTTKADGMGLGLAISRSIIESHGGRLWATPAKPFGSTFHVVLPFTDAEGAQ
jgi:signal transduction histidine kinase